MSASSHNRTPPTAREFTGIVLRAVVFTLFLITFVVQDVKIATGSMKNTILVGDHLLIDKFLFERCLDGPLPLLPQRKIERGDIIVFKYPTDPTQNFVKRVVGLPGETIEIRGMNVFINGETLPEVHRIINLEYDRLHMEEPLVVDEAASQPTGRAGYAVFYGRSATDREATSGGGIDPTRTDEARYAVGGPYLIPPDHYFCLGDNRDNSQDSRHWGVVPRGAIVGSPRVVVYSSPPAAGKGVFSWLTSVFSPRNWNRIGTRLQ